MERKLDLTAQIIDEFSLPADQKTVQPIQIGGVGGGEKFLVRSILFKFAVDVNGFLGDETGEKAAKVAGADLRGLIAYFNCHIPGLHFPMMSLVDYKGYRVIAEAEIPISKGTLVYGSSDGGITVCNDDSVLEEKMKLAAKKLNLKPHNGFCGSYLYSATDVEGHRGRDGRHYILDFARALPPESPSTGLPKVQGGAFFRFLRPEFLRNCGPPLNPDCYSKFCHPADKEQDSSEIDSATLVLLMGVVPKFAALVDDIDLDGPDSITRHSLTLMAHENGVPLRYLGTVISHLHSAIWQEYFMLEMLARTVKSVVRHQMRTKTIQNKAMGIQVYKTVAVETLNLVLECPHIMKKDVHLQFWKDLKDAIRNKFPGGITSVHLNTSQTLFQHFEQLKNPKWMLFQKVKKLLGLKFFKSSRFSRTGYFDRASPLDVIDLKDLLPVLKQMNVSAMSQGYILKTKIMRRKEDIGVMFDMAVSKFEEALDSMPENKLVLMHLGDLYKMNNDPDQAQKFYRRSLLVDSEDAYTNYKYASFLSSVQDPEAENYYRQALKLNPKFVWCMEEFAEFLANKAMTKLECLKEAKQLFELSLQVTKYKRASVIHNYGIFLLKFCGEFEKAEEMLWKAYQMEPTKAVYASNLKWFLENIKGDFTDISQILRDK